MQSEQTNLRYPLTWEANLLVAAVIVLILIGGAAVHGVWPHSNNASCSGMRHLACRAMDCNPSLPRSSNPAPLPN